MTTKRIYEDGCATAHALNLVGERWALLVIRELLPGPRRFTDLRAGLPGISANVLTQRLEDLEAAAIVRRRKLPPPAAAWVYEMTDWGSELEPVFYLLGRWGARSSSLPLGAPVSAASLVLSLRAMFSREAARGFDASLELRLGEDRFHAEVRGERFRIERGVPPQPAAVLKSDPTSLVGVFYGGRRLGEAIRSGAVQVEGDRSVAQRFMTLFPLPERVAAAS